MKKRRLVLSLLSGALMLGFSTTAFASTFPQTYQQNKTNWCWAATAVLVGETNGGATLAHTAVRLIDTTGIIEDAVGIDNEGYYTAYNPQRAIVVNEFTDDGNHSGSFTNLQNALQYVSDDDMEIGKKRLDYDSDYISTIQDETTDGRYVAGFVAKDVNSYGHFVTVFSYSASMEKYGVYDPWNKKTQYVTKSQAFDAGINVAGWTTKYRIVRIDYCR